MASGTVQSGLQLYLRQINELPLLTADEEKALARRIIGENDPAARERMVRSNLRLVVVIAFHSPTQSGSADGELTINELVADQHNPTPDETVINNDELDQLGHLLEEIDERASKILKLRYGLDGADPMTLKEIGQQIGL